MNRRKSLNIPGLVDVEAKGNSSTSICVSLRQNERETAHKRTAHDTHFSKTDHARFSSSTLV